jgi:uncharacterized MAPEG superfamily protein
MRPVPNLAVACVPVALLLIYVPRLAVARAQAQLPEGYDNANPRDQQARLSGLGKRAQGAHLNAFEAFPAFAAAVILCEVLGCNRTYENALAIGFVALRSVYIALYLGDKPSARSSVWGLGFLATLGLYLLPWLGR